MTTTTELSLSRRRILQAGVGGLLAMAASRLPAAEPAAFKLKYILSSALYGKMDLAHILPEVRKTGTEHIDIWRLPHGNQREQLDEIGVDFFAEMMAKHQVKLGSFTAYPLGAFGLKDELKIVKKLGGKLIVTGVKGSKDPAGEEARREVKALFEQLKPHADAAGEAGITIAIENHANCLLQTPDSLRYFAEFNPFQNVGVAFAPHHFHVWADRMPKMIEDLGRHLVFFYAQEHGKGFMQALPKEDELMQLPGFGGGLDYKPVVAALKKINFGGFVEIFMHPTPRGIPILPTAGEITTAVNKSRAYLDACL